MELTALLSTDGGMLAAAVFGITFGVRVTLSKTLSRAVLAETWVKVVSMLLPLALGPLLGLALLSKIEDWEGRVLLGLVAATVVMVGRDLLKLGGQAVAHGGEA